LLPFSLAARFEGGEISIGRNCWIASNVTILNNVIIGAGA
jgi:acetyltransferase-like isoleucine patch superfamily enzyme